jgi:hypothetical protein
MTSEEFVTAVREIVDYLDALHEFHGTLSEPELKLFVNLKNALCVYDAQRERKQKEHG